MPQYCSCGAVLCSRCGGHAESYSHAGTAGSVADELCGGCREAMDRSRRQRQPLSPEQRADLRAARRAAAPARAGYVTPTSGRPDIPNYCDREEGRQGGSCFTEWEDPDTEVPLHRDPGDFKTHPRRFVGAEIEIAEIADDAWCSDVLDVVEKWGGESVFDGSLPSGGFEVRTAPAAGRAFQRQMREITKALHQVSAKVNKRCGLHIHIEGHDLHYPDIRRLIEIYSRLEKGAFHVVAPSRRNTSFAHESASYYGDLIEIRVGNKGRQALVKTLYGGEYAKRRLKPGKRPGDVNAYEAVPMPPYHFRTKKGRKTKHHSRYHALNLHSWYEHGTVEIRLHQGTVDYSKIVFWSMLWSNVVEAAVWWSDAETTRWVQDPEAGGSSHPIVPLLSLCPTQECQDHFVARYNYFQGRERHPEYEAYESAPPAPVRVNPRRRRSY